MSFCCWTMERLSVNSQDGPEDLGVDLKRKQTGGDRDLIGLRAIQQCCQCPVPERMIKVMRIMNEWSKVSVRS